ncbi:MAG: endonuclease NucS domain-containing protein [Pseudomonadales bacterium]
MYKVDIQSKTLIELDKATFAKLGLKERFDIQEWIEKTPSILGEDLLVIAKEYELPSRSRLDLLAIDKQANLVIVELKRDESGSSVDWQSIKYASYCSNFTHKDIYCIYATYLGIDEDEAELKIESFITEQDSSKLNESQRIILASREFHSDVVSAVLWLMDFGIDMQCVKLEPFIDQDGGLFINPSIIIPLPEAKDYIKRKETKTKERSISKSSSFSLEKSSLGAIELEAELVSSLSRPGDLTPRVRAFFEILLAENKSFDREEIKLKLFNSGVGNDIGHTGRLLSNISQFLTKKSNPHLRQVVEFQTGGSHGETKNNYQIADKYRVVVTEALQKTEVESSV